MKINFATATIAAMMVTVVPLMLTTAETNVYAATKSRIANFSHGQPATASYEELSFVVNNNNDVKSIRYSWGKDFSEEQSEYLGPDHYGKQKSFRIRIRNRLVHVIPKTSGLSVVDLGSGKSKSFSWKYEGPVNGIGTFCDECLGSKDSILLVKKFFL